MAIHRALKPDDLKKLWDPDQQLPLGGGDKRCRPINTYIARCQREGEDMAKKLTAEQARQKVLAIDWADLFQKLPQLAAIVWQLIELLRKKEQMMAVAKASAKDCPEACEHLDRIIDAACAQICEALCCKECCGGGGYG